jgi:hypothetical protein
MSTAMIRRSLAPRIVRVDASFSLMKRLTATRPCGPAEERDDADRHSRLGPTIETSAIASRRNRNEARHEACEKYQRTPEVAGGG